MDEVKHVEKQEIEIEKIIFSKIEVEKKAEKLYSKTNYFTTTKKEEGEIVEANPNLKEILKELFKVTSIEEIIEITEVDDWKIKFKNGSAPHKIDEKNKTVNIYIQKAKELVDLNKKLEKGRRVFKNICKDNSKVKPKELIVALDLISDGIKDKKFNKSEMEELKKLIPKMIKNGDIKLNQDDISEMNKKEIEEILHIGYGILNRENGIAKQLGIPFSQLRNEIAWQKYFEKYGKYLLFGSTNVTKKVQGEVKAKKELTGRTRNSRFDIITLNRYGFLDIVELKKSDCNILSYDSSHDTFYPTAELSKAVSQLNNYLMLLPSAYSEEKKITIDGNIKTVRNFKKGAESASGMLIVSSTKEIMTPNTRERIKKARNIKTESELDEEIKLYLREYNYSLAHIEIITYDDLLENLKEFSSSLEIEFKK